MAQGPARGADGPPPRGGSTAPPTSPSMRLDGGSEGHSGRDNQLPGDASAGTGLHRLSWGPVSAFHFGTPGGNGEGEGVVRAEAVSWLCVCSWAGRRALPGLFGPSAASCCGRADSVLESGFRRKGGRSPRCQWRQLFPELSTPLNLHWRDRPRGKSCQMSW